MSASRTVDGDKTGALRVCAGFSFCSIYNDAYIPILGTKHPWAPTACGTFTSPDAVSLVRTHVLTGEERYLRAAQSMGASRFEIFRHVLIPYAFPVMLTGLRIGFFICFASVLGGETLSSVAGVGRNIALAAELMEPARMFAWISFVICTAITLNMLVTAIENHVARAEGSR
mgnify:CR=1 FL=1